MAVTERRAAHSYLSGAADVLEARFEEIFVSYEQQLVDMENPLVAEAATREQLRMQAQSILEEVAKDLRGQEDPSEAQKNEGSPSASIGTSRARGSVHPSESLRAATALSEAALVVVVDNLPSSTSSRSEVAAVALALQRSILERVAKASVSYGSYLIGKLHQAHADERRRIGRDLHDKVAHSVMFAFQNLELYEAYREQDPSRAWYKFEIAKTEIQGVLKSIRTLSKELRSSSAEEGLEVALSEYLRLIVPPEVQAWVSVEGDESLIPPERRDELLLVLREAVCNAVEHSGAQTIKIELHTTQYQVRAVVEDDGCGFEPKEPVSVSGGMGLSSMEERISLLGGKFNLASSSGSGTKIEILVPLPRSRP